MRSALRPASHSCPAIPNFQKETWGRILRKHLCSKSLFPRFPWSRSSVRLLLKARENKRTGRKSAALLKCPEIHLAHRAAGSDSELSRRQSINVTATGTSCEDLSQS